MFLQITYSKDSISTTVHRERSDGKIYDSARGALLRRAYKEEQMNQPPLLDEIELLGKYKEQKGWTNAQLAMIIKNSSADICSLDITMKL